MVNCLNYSLEKMLGVNCIFCSALYHRDSFNMVGGYNTNMKYGFEDWDFWLGILERYPTCSVCQIDEILFYYRTNPYNISTLVIGC